MSALPAFSIREATLDDLPAIQAMSYELFIDPTSSGDSLLDSTWSKDERGEKYFRTWIENSTDTMLVAESPNELVGFLSG
ncbi:MAG TPA: hypothetical protein VF272_01515, partial [Candidatus Saccharimonadia bacterium]